MTENFIMRGDLPPNMPDRMKRLPLSKRGFPVPWFVQWLEEEGSEKATPVGEGYPEFRMMRPEAYRLAMEGNRCWVCGGQMGRYKAFVAGPMCGVNRTTAEPPCHRDCAEWSARACPFLSMPKMVRRENKLDQAKGEMPGQGLTRNPGLAMVWVTTSHKTFSDGKGGTLIELGEPEEVVWICEGRDATREEILASIDSGLPLLAATIEQEPEDQQEAARAELDRRRSAVVDNLLPAA